MPTSPDLELLKTTLAQADNPDPAEAPIKFREPNRAEVALMKVPSWFTAGKDTAAMAFDHEGGDVRIVKFAKGFLKAAHAHGIPVKVSEIYRGEARQNELRLKGFSRASWGNSAHNFGKAVDLIHATKGWDLTAHQWALMGIIGKEIARRQNLKLEWGGDWSFYDPAHWELATWKKEKALG